MAAKKVSAKVSKNKSTPKGASKSKKPLSTIEFLSSKVRQIGNFFRASWSWISNRIYQIWVFLKSRIGLATVFILSISALAIWTAWPKEGDFLIIVRQEVSDPDGRAQAIVRNAKALTDSRLAFASRLGEMFGDEPLNIPFEENLNGNALSDYIDLSIAAARDGEYTDYSFSVNLVSLIQAQINTYASNLAVRTVVEDWRDDQAPQYAITLRLYGGSTFVVLEPRQSELVLTQGISKFLLEDAYSERFDCTTSICPEDSPDDLEVVRELANIVDAFPVLRNGGICREIDVERACLSRIRMELEAMQEESDAAAIDFVRFLTEMSILSREVAANARSPEIARALNEAYRSLLRATQGSPYFEGLLGDAERLDQFLENAGFSDLELTSDFLMNYSAFSDGRSAMQQARYVDALSSFEEVFPLSPSWFQDYISYFRDFAILRSQLTDQSNLEALISSFSGSARGFTSDLLHHAFALRSFVALAAVSGKDMGENERASLIEAGQQHFDEIALLVEEDADQWAFELLLQRLRFLLGDDAVRQGSMEEATAVLGRIQPETLGHESEYEQRLLLMTAAAWASSVEDTDLARSYAERAVKVYPSNLCVIQNDPEYTGLRHGGSQPYPDWLRALRQLENPECS